MYIADVYWLVLSQLRAGQADEAQKTLQQHYRPDMYVGHHTETIRRYKNRWMQSARGWQKELRV